MIATLYVGTYQKYVTLPISPTSLIISVTHGLWQTKLVYILDSMKVYKVLPLDVSLMVTKIHFHALSM